MERCKYSCGSSEHGLSRRGFLGGLAAGTLGFAGMVHPASAKELQREQRRVLVVDFHGGVSQLETWDPKPGTNTGGPFQTIATSVPGIHLCELLPFTAKQMHRLAIVRGLNTAENDHGKGRYIMETGRRKEPAFDYPNLGSVAAKLFSNEASGLPGFLQIRPGKGGGFNKQDAAFLGPRFGSVTLGDGEPPANLLRSPDLTLGADKDRNDMRTKLNDRFLQARKTAETEAYTASFDQAEQLMAKKDVFDLSREPMKLRDQYGSHDFGRHCLLARRLLENGATFVKVAHSNYDTHHENFDFHIEQLGEWDRPFATLIEDLAVRGMLETTLVIVMSEFGRTPTINRNYGRDHWGTAWSVALGGCGIKAGAVVGKTNANGTAVTDRMVNGGHLFHTYLKALGLDSNKNHYFNQRPIPMADPKAEPIKEILGVIPKIDPTKTKLLKDYKHTSPLIGCRFDPTGKFVFVSAQDNSLQRFQLDTGTKVSFNGHKSWVRAIAFSKDGKTLFSADYAGKILLWQTDADKPEPRLTIDAHGNRPENRWVRALSLSPDGKTLASVGNDGKACLWSAVDGKPVKSWQASDCHVYNVAFHPDGKSLATADLKGVVKHWDLTGNLTSAARQLDAAILCKYDQSFRADIGGVRSMAFSADGALLACAGITNVSNAFAGIGNPLIVLLDWKTGQRKHLLKPKAAFQGTMWGVTFHPGGLILGTAGGNAGQLYFWNADKPESVHNLALPNNARDLALHNDGRRVAIPFFDGTVRLYDLMG